VNVEIGAEAAQFPEKEYINGIAVAVFAGKNLKFQRFVSDIPAGGDGKNDNLFYSVCTVLLDEYMSIDE
jgi:hypothetical protein